MRKKNIILISALLATMAFSCGSPNGDKTSNPDAVLPVDTTMPLGTSSKKISKVKFEAFNNVDNVRQKLSAVGIGELGRWRDDGRRGFSSASPYYQFDGGEIPNELAYFLQSDDSTYIKTLKLVLNINNGKKKSALAKFAETIGKTYEALGLGPDTKIMNEAKHGKELKGESGTYRASIAEEKPGRETWEFVIETK
jgi:hypothetical protein